MATLQTIINLVICELDIFFAFSWMDWSTTITPSLIFSIGVAQSSGSSSAMLTPPYSLTTCYVYFFHLSDQIMGIVEDQVDKLHWPLQSGKVTLAGAKKHCIVVLLIWFLVFMHASVLEPMLCNNSQTINWKIHHIGGKWAFTRKVWSQWWLGLRLQQECRINVAIIWFLDPLHFRAMWTNTSGDGNSVTSMSDVLVSHDGLHTYVDDYVIASFFLSSCNVYCSVTNKLIKLCGATQVRIWH